MNDTIESVCAEDVFQCAVTANIYLGQCVSRIFNVFANVLAFDVWAVEVVEVVDDDDLIDVAREQSINEMRADESGASGHENIFHDYFVA